RPTGGRRRRCRPNPGRRAPLGRGPRPPEAPGRRDARAGTRHAGRPRPAARGGGGRGQARRGLRAAGAVPRARRSGAGRLRMTAVPQAAVQELTMGQAVREALAEEMRRDPTVFLIGEDVAEAGTPFKVLSGLVEEFGPERVMDTPISEPGFTGIALGAAMTGMRPVVDIMFGDFMTLVMDQVINQAAKIHYMSGGKLRAPLVVRTTLGATRRSAAQHSQSLHALASHLPGLKVALPSTPGDAKGLMTPAIQADNPVILFEDK